MTYLERLRAEHPGFFSGGGDPVAELCPEDLGYEKKSICRFYKEENDYLSAGGETCRRCWEREIEYERTSL